VDTTIIPFDQLDPETLKNLVTEFIGREGTDYGDREIDMPTKVEQVLQKIKAGEVVITYSEKEESANLVPARQISDILHSDKNKC